MVGGRMPASGTMSNTVHTKGSQLSGSAALSRAIDARVAAAASRRATARSSAGRLGSTGTSQGPRLLVVGHSMRTTTTIPAQLVAAIRARLGPSRPGIEASGMTKTNTIVSDE